MKWYMYRKNGMDIKRTSPSMWLGLTGWKLMLVVDPGETSRAKGGKRAK